MKRADFHVGLIFNTAIGRWKCTDVGTRTISAIHLDDPEHGQDPRWTEGPPYGLEEKVFDEHAIECAFLTLRGMVDDRLATGGALHFTPGPLAFQHVRRRRECRQKEKAGGPRAYPMNTLKGIRVDLNGDHLSAYGANQDTFGNWYIEVFNFNKQQEEVRAEADWRAMPLWKKSA